MPLFWAECIGGVCPSVLSRQRFQQHFGLLQVRHVKALCEPAIDRGQERVRFGLLPLLPEATQTHRRP